ncbi:ABC transporter substrate-binding protein [Streptomyces sp. 6-11-2]|uniref:ABC transporter substrate-binding protein n=1 Tax=Streptomyces sp. 6-11-2 TaxID=2585753 RepID=UPI0011432423|nr:sugar ABC transporter substrate-binding protein [Streptomyces sp. 6-11-2]GED89668.1 sugar ABC transporter substrate-binding protein [Streptomyces sp. 6-11-2]
MSAAPTRSRTALRAAAALTAAALSATLLAACGSDDDRPASGSGKPVDITFWGWAKGTQQVVDAFNASHKDVHVSYEEIPSGSAGGYAKLSNAVKAHNAPDVFNVEYPQLPDFVSQGAVQDIGKYVGADLKAKYLPQAVQLTTLGGATYALPLDAAPQAFYYRKDLFDKAGIEVPTTWGEFRTAAEKLKKAEPGSRIATFFPDDPTTFEAMAWQAGAQWFGTAGDTWQVNLEAPETKKVADYWQKMINDDLVRVEPSFSQQWTASLQKGQTAGYLGASWGGGVLKGTLPKDQAGKWAVAPLPSWNGTPASGMLGGTTFAVSKDSKKAEAAVEFATWATTTAQGIQARISSGDSSAFPADPALVPVAAKAFKADFYGGQDIYGVYKSAAGSIEQKWTWGPAMGVTNNSLKDSFGKLSSGSGTIAQALAAAQKDTVSELKNRGLKVSAP